MSEFRRRLAAHGKPGGTGESPEFIEFRANKYVPTGVTASSEIKVRLKVKFLSLGSYQFIIGWYAGAWFNMGPYAGYVEDYYANQNNIKIPISEFKIGNVIEIVKDKNKTYVDDVLKAEHKYKQFSRTDIIGIGGNTFNLNADIYNFAFWQDDILIDEYYPYVVDGKEYFKGKNTGKLLEVITKE